MIGKISLSKWLILTLLIVPAAWAQSGNDEPQSATVQSGAGAAPAMGQEPAPPSTSDFPPLSGLDEPSLEPNVAARSFLVYGGQVSEFADTNASNGLNRHSSPITGVTNLLGTAALQRLWERYQLGLQYVGGGSIYAGGARKDGQIQELNFDARTLWRTGAFTIRDSASYLPDGTFGGSFGGAGGLSGAGLGAVGAGGLGGAGGNRFTFFGANGFGGLGAIPRVMNLAIADVQQSLSPRSAFTLSAGYGLMHFTQSTGGLLMDSRQTSAQAGYDYTINRRNKLALIYGYQHFQFPTTSGLGFVTHLAQLLYGYQITGRMDLLLGAGPQFTRLSSAATGSTLKLSASARASLRYKFPKTSLILAYDRYNSVAAGFFAGGLTDTARFTAVRPFGRRWTGALHLGYTHSKRFQTAPIGVNAGSFQAGFVGVRLTRVFSRSLQGFVLYDFNELQFDRSICASAACGRTSTRNIVGVGLTWHPHPIRLD